jgi:hypothetical protein
VIFYAVVSDEIRRVIEFDSEGVRRPGRVGFYGCG